MQIQPRAGKVSPSGLAVLTALSLSGLVLLTPRQSAAQERPTPQDKPIPQEKPQDKDRPQDKPLQEKTATTTQRPTIEPSVSTALNDLRRAVIAELGKTPALAGKTLDDQKVLITTTKGDNLIAGAAAPARVSLGITSPGDRVPTDTTKPPVDPTKPATDPTKAADPSDDPNAVGVVLLMGSFAPQSGTRSTATDAGARSTNTFGGTYIVRRASTTSRDVQIVDSRQQVVATVPLLYFDNDARPIESGARDAGARPGAGTAGGTSGTGATGTGSTATGAQRDTAPGTLPNVEGDWARIYMSIVHYFNPDLG